MTTSTANVLANEAAGLTLALRSYTAPVGRATDGAYATEAGTNPVYRIPTLDALQDAAEALARFAGPAIAAPIIATVAPVADHLRSTIHEARFLAKEVNSQHPRLALADELIAQAADLIHRLGNEYVSAALANVSAEARLEVIEDVLSRELADSPPAHRGGVWRETNKRAARLARERRDQLIPFTHTPPNIEDYLTGELDAGQ